MVAFARSKAKSIFSKLQFINIDKKQIETKEMREKEAISNQNKISSNYFLEAIKNGGIWLS